MKHMNIIAIDCGASFIKATRINDNDIVDTIIEKTPSDDNSQKLEISSEIIKNAIKKLSRDGEILHIGFSNEMHGFVLTDENGKPITKYISWQNECAKQSYNNSTYLDYLRNRIDKSNIMETGMPLKCGLPSANLFYLFQNELRDYDGELFFYTLGDYYIRNLTGKEPFIHETNAAGTGLYNVRLKCWDKDIISEVCAENKVRLIMPTIHDGHAPIEMERNRKWLVYPALGDQQAALYGAGLSKKNELSLNFGTGAQMSTVLDHTVFSEDYQLRPFFNNLYLKTVPHIPSGRAINVFFNFVKEIVNEFSDADDESVWNFINTMAKKNEKELLKTDLSFFANALTIYDKGSVSNIGENTFTVGNLFDSIYNQVADNIKTIFREKLGNEIIERIYISGGVLRKNDYLKQIVLKEFENVSDVIIAENETARGIAKFIKGNN